MALRVALAFRIRASSYLAFLVSRGDARPAFGRSRSQSQQRVFRSLMDQGALPLTPVAVPFGTFVRLGLLFKPIL